MILKIICWIWIISGILFLIKPDMLRNKLRKKSSRKVMWFLCGLALAIGIFLIKVASSMVGLPGLILKIFGIIAVIKAFLFLNGKFSETIMAWFSSQPISFFRIWAVVQIVIGLTILNLPQ